MLFAPHKVTFEAGPQLHFLFHSDSSNNEWGYKFTVTAHGLPDITVSWMSDLQLLVARLMGRLASRTMALKSPHGEREGWGEGFRGGGGKKERGLERNGDRYIERERNLPISVLSPNSH